jgi:hypothetical protein
MKVLVTGCTALQIDSQNRTISKIDVPASIVEALRSRGHEVDWRKVDPGEDLTSYDVAWVCLAPINSLNGRAGAMGSLYVMSSGLPCVGFADDWQVSAVWNGMRALNRKPEMLYKYMLVGAAHRGEEAATYFSRDEVYAAFNRVVAQNPEAAKKCYVDRCDYTATDEQVTPYADRLVATAAAFDTERWARGMVLVCPMYAWGDRSLVRKRLAKTIGPVEALDPSSTIYPLIAPHTALPPDEKKRTWMLGALMPHDTWLQKKEFTWPVEYMGAKNMVKKYGGERVKTESDVIDRYNQVWGILSPPYPHAGSGWWRSRFMYAAKVQSILVCDKGEGDPLGSPYRVRMPQVEAMTTPQLAQLAQDQAAALRPYMPDPSTFADHCEHIIYRAQREDRGWTYDG